MKNEDNYLDIINLEYKKSNKYPRMLLIDRAAQFGAFTPLEGHIDALRDTEIEKDREILENNKNNN